MAIKRIAPSGGDYTTLSAWITSLPGTLTEPEIAELEAFDLVDQITVANVTSPANYIEIRAAAGHEHGGVFGVGARIRHGASATNSPIVYPGRHFRLKNIEIFADRSGSTYPALKDAGGAVSGSDVRIENCLVRSVVTGDNFTIQATAANLNLTVVNTVVTTSCRVADTRGATTVKLHNCTFWRTADVLGVVAGATTEIQNTYCGKASGTQQDYWSGASPTGNNNASSDTTATARFTSSYNSVSGASAFTNAASRDFTLLSSSPLLDVGATLGTVTTDIIGTSRPQGSAYDIGAFERSVGGSGTTITGNLGTATAAGIAATILAATTIAGNIGQANAAGYQATIQTGSNTTISASLGTATAAGYQATVTTSGTGYLITEPLKNNTGTLLASQTGATAFVYNVSTGALVVAKTSQTTDASGVMTISDALITPATQYRVVVVLSGGAEGLAKYTAS